MAQDVAIPELFNVQLIDTGEPRPTTQKSAGRRRVGLSGVVINRFVEREAERLRDHDESEQASIRRKLAYAQAVETKLKIKAENNPPSPQPEGAWNKFLTFVENVQRRSVKS